MLLIYLLVAAVLFLLTFSMSRETGKNTKHARKGANAIVQNQTIHTQLISDNKISEVN